MRSENSKDKLNQVIEFASQNLSCSEISKRAGVSKTTVSRWLKKMENKTQGVTDIMIVEAVNALRQRVRGFQIVESKTTFVMGADNILKVKERVDVTKDVAPDLAAIEFMLTNRDREHWQHKPEVNSVNVEAEHCHNVDLSKLSEQALEELYKACSD